MITVRCVYHFLCTSVSLAESMNWKDEKKKIQKKKKKKRLEMRTMEKHKL